MTAEELLKPRYKVMGLYPFSPFKLGEILVRIPHTTEELYAERNWKPGYPNISKEWLEICPRLFEILPWFAERKPEDMPEYVKAKDSSGEVSKVIEHFSKPFASKPNHPVCKVEYLVNGAREFYYELLPATREEYESFLNSK